MLIACLSPSLLDISNFIDMIRLYPLVMGLGEINEPSKKVQGFRTWYNCFDDRAAQLLQTSPVPRVAEY